MAFLEGEITTICTSARATKGFVIPESFADAVLVYRTDYAGRGVIEHAEVNGAQIQSWSDLA